MLLADDSPVESTLKPRSDAATMPRAVLRSRLALRCQDGSASRGVVENEGCKVERGRRPDNNTTNKNEEAIDGYNRAANEVAVVKLRRERSEAL